MSLFDFGKGKDPERGLEQVLAYLEAALRGRSPFLLDGLKRPPVPASMHSLHEDSKTFRLLAAERPPVAKGDRLEIVFFMDGLRFGATVKVLEAHSEVVQCQLPDAIEIRERRRTPRARMNPKERSAVVAHQAPGEGIGIQGILENLSEGGMRVRVESAMAIATETRMVAGTTLVPQGQAFKVIRIAQLRTLSPVELSGKVVYLAYEQGGLVMGFHFDKPASGAHSTLRSLVATRTGPIPDTLPSKVRRRLVQEEEPPPEPESVPTLAPAASAGPEPPPPPPPPVDKRAALLRMKKQSRGMVVYAPAGYQAGTLRTFLTGNGFGRVAVHDQLHALLECLRQPNQGALFVDWNGETREAIELMILLREAYEDLPPVVLAVRKVDEAYLLAAREAGAAYLMVKPYACDEAFVALLEGCFMNQAQG